MKKENFRATEMKINKYDFSRISNPRICKRKKKNMRFHLHNTSIQRHQIINNRKKHQSRVMRMNRRRAAMKEYLRAATRIAREMKKSCHSTWTLAQVRRPVNPMERMFSGSGSRRSRHLSRPSLFKSPPKLRASPISFGSFSCPFLPPVAETTINLLSKSSFLG